MMRWYCGVRAAMVAAALVATPTLASSQYRGYFVPGLGGMNAGRAVVPGNTAALTYLLHGAGAFRDGAGDTTALVPGASMHRAEVALSHASRSTIAGAHFGATLRAFVGHAWNGVEEPRDSSSSRLLGSLYLEPLSLGWELHQGAVRVAYGIVTPWTQNASLRSLSHVVTVGSTYYIDALRETEVSLNSVTEFHGRQQRSHVTVGDHTTLELALGQSFPMDDVVRVWIGYAAYGQWQFNGDTGPGYTGDQSRRRDRVFGFGPEAGVVLTELKTTIVVRTETEFAARSRMEGAMLLIGVAKSF